MSPRSLLRCSVAISLMFVTFACKRTSADVSFSTAPRDARTDVVADENPESVDEALPSHVMLPWNTELFSAPSEDAYVMTLVDPGEGSGRAVAVVGQRDGWWQIETITQADVEVFGAEPIEGLDFYRLQLYVPAGTGWPVRELPPGPDAPGSARETTEGAAQGVVEADDIDSGILAALSGESLLDPPLQSGYRAPELTKDWRVSASATVFWPDGRLAGEVRTEHAFASPGVASEHGDLLCFDVRIGPVHDGAGQLCFASTSVREAEVTHPGGIWGGLGGSDDSAGDLRNEISKVDHSSGTSLGRAVPTVTMSKPRVTEAMDADVAHAIVRPHFYEVLNCWENEKPSDATTGKVNVELDVTAKGDVAKAEAQADNEAHDAVARCIEKAAAGWAYPSDMAGSIELDFGFAP